ncbi:MAG: hypothetical protein V2I26_18520 [Halieaceae bacterium]|nr:hypothetical protein [Halieaceae bacterium]
MKRYRQILLHAGLSKTGSTSIQANCRRYRGFLLAHGIVYPQFSFGDRPFTMHSIPLTAAITGSGKYGLRLHRRFPGVSDKVIAACRAQLHTVLAAGRGEDLLLSTELVADYDDGDMQALKALLLEHGDRVRVLAYIRSPQSVLESMLQERVKAAAKVDPLALVGRVRHKLENLQRNFTDSLEVINFHEAQSHPLGLVGSFLTRLGLLEEDLSELTFSSGNERISMEAFQLMSAINQRFPWGGEQAGFQRKPHDMDGLMRLPGQPFQLQGFAGSDVYKACMEEAAWLESRLGFRFPETTRASPGPLWQDDTLLALHSTISAILQPQLRRYCAEYLESQAAFLAASRPVTAAALLAIGQRLALSA